MWINLKGRGILVGVVLLFCTALEAFAQSPCSYRIISVGNYSLPVLKAALDNAQLDAYRFKTLPRTLNFDQNAQVELLSGLEMTNNGCPVDALKAMPDGTPVDANRTFSVHPSGVLMETVAPRSKQ